jgi:hypothetical protein
VQEGYRGNLSEFSNQEKWNALRHKLLKSRNRSQSSDCEGHTSVDRELRKKMLQAKMSVEELKLPKPEELKW